MAITYRPFRNFDPPALVQIWNESLTGRGAAFLQNTLPLEHYLFAKPYFDPRGLIVAAEDGQPIGFAHAGFGPDAAGRALATETGVVCAVLVRPGHRRKGIGAALLHHAETYLRDRGARTVYFGAMRPLTPFYLGLYGGSELPGVLASDTAAEPFLIRNRYTIYDRCLVLRRNLEPPPKIVDARFVGLRRKYEMQAAPRPTSERWYEECLFAPLEITEFQLRDKLLGTLAARGTAWEMDMFSWRSHQPTAGIMEIEVREDYRRQGIGKFLMVQMLEHLQNQFFTHVELQTMERNAIALKLYQTLGFQKVDEGRVYKLES